MNRSILALDLATWTGIALWRPGMERPRAFVWKLPKKVADDDRHIPRFTNAFENNLVSLLQLERPDYCVFEAPWVGENTHQDTARKLMGLAILTDHIAYRHKVATYEVNQTDVRSHFLGAGCRGHRHRRPGEDGRDALKRMTMETCAARGWPVENNDEADACAVLDYSVWTLRKLMQVPWDCSPNKGALLERGRAA